LIDFYTPLDIEIERKTSVTVTTRVTVTQVEQRKRYVGKADAEWGWEGLSDYVLAKLESRTGPIPERRTWNDPEVKIASVFKGFWRRWEDKAPAMARFAMEHCDGVVEGVTVSLTSFCAKSDPFFAKPIAKRMGILNICLLQ
jgi:hypothetical protein